MDRNSTLRTSFNAFWSDVFGEGNYYDKLSLAQFVDLKRALSDINNIITLKTTNLFVDKLLYKGLLTGHQHKKALSLINEISANANGYDVELDDPKIIAEVKCNIPVAGTAFGAAQVNGIMKDLRQMWMPENKSKSSVSADNGYLRFMVMLDYAGVREAMQQIIKKAVGENIRIMDEDKLNRESLSMSCIYIVYVPIC